MKPAHLPPTARSGALTGCPLPVAVQAGTLVGLELEQLDQPDGLVGGRDELQGVPVVGHQQSGRVGGEQRHAVGGQGVQHVEHVEVGHQRVGDPDQGRQQRRLPVLPGRRHHSSSVKRSVRATTSRATASIGRSWTKAWARRVASAASGEIANWAMIIPVAW